MNLFLRYMILFFLLFNMVAGVAQSIPDSATLQSSQVIQNENTEAPIADSSHLRTLSEDDWNATKKDKAFIYTHEKKKIKKEHIQPPPLTNISNLFNSSLFKLMMFLVVAALLIFLIYQLFFTGERTFMNRQKKKKNINEISSEHIEEFSDWEKALQEALLKNDYREAIRILYLQTLQKMNQAGWIQFEQEKTNWDYVTQLAQSQHVNEFRILTNYFDYIWYGGFYLNKETYQSIETHYRNFQQNIL